MQGESHRIPGPPQRRFDAEQLAKQPDEKRLEVKRELMDTSLAPHKSDAKRMGDKKKASPID